MNSGQTREVWFILETEHQTMRELHADLVRDGSLCGTRYETRADGDRRRVVKDAFDAIIMGDTITSVMEMADDLYDQDGEALWLLESGEAA